MEHQATPQVNEPAGAAEASSAAEAKARKSIDERIEEAEAELRRLREAKRRKEQEDRERNERELKSLLAAEKLNLIAAATWRKALPEIRAALERAGMPASEESRTGSKAAAKAARTAPAAA